MHYFDKYAPICCLISTPDYSDDISKAIIQMHDHALNNMDGFGKAVIGEINGVKKISCSKAQGDPGYNCDVEIDI